MSMQQAPTLLLLDGSLALKLSSMARWSMSRWPLGQVLMPSLRLPLQQQESTASAQGADAQCHGDWVVAVCGRSAPTLAAARLTSRTADWAPNPPRSSWLAGVRRTVLACRVLCRDASFNRQGKVLSLAKQSHVEKKPAQFPYVLHKTLGPTAAYAQNLIQ